MVIMFAGKAGAGKDTAAMLVRSFIPDAKQFAFATRVKEIAYLLGWHGEKDEKGRKLLQDIGKAGRNYNEDKWAQICVDAINASSTQLALITDLRFRNELKVVKASYPDAKVVLVCGRQADLGKNANDVSEHDLDGFAEYDFILDNSGSESELIPKIQEMLAEFGFDSNFAN